jgi:6-phosphogluconolactonase
MHAVSHSITDSIPMITAIDKVALGQKLAHDILPILQEAIKVRDKMVLIVSGGSTPMPFFQALAASDIDHSKLMLLMADERWVDPSHSDSNEALLREAFAEKDIQLFSLAPLGEETVEAGAQRLDAALRHQEFRADIAILGMGEDGHTASLFPDHAGLKEGLNPDSTHYCIAVNNSPKPPTERVTLTYAALMRSGQIIIHCTGEAKKEILAQADMVTDVRELPIAAFLQQRSVPCSVYWCE